LLVHDYNASLKTRSSTGALKRIYEQCPGCPDKPDSAMTSDLSENTGFMPDFHGLSGRQG